MPLNYAFVRVLEFKKKASSSTYGLDLITSSVTISHGEVVIAAAYLTRDTDSYDPGFL